MSTHGSTIDPDTFPHIHQVRACKKSCIHAVPMPQNGFTHDRRRSFAFGARHVNDTADGEL
eukprot:scaffold1060_cov196-Amphora_coffeaeformis.AAC.26